MRYSARNKLEGTVTEVDEGVVTGEVKIDIGGGKVITSSITMDAVRELDIKVGDKVVAIIKASSVIVAKD